MKALRSDVWLWDIMESSGKGGYGERVTDKLDDYIEQAGKLEELTDSLYEGLIGMSFDSMYDSFISSLMDMEKSAEDLLMTYPNISCRRCCQMPSVNSLVTN